MLNHDTPSYWGDTFDMAVVYHLVSLSTAFRPVQCCQASCRKQHVDVAADPSCILIAAQHYTLLPRLCSSKPQLQLCRICYCVPLSLLPQVAPLRCCAMCMVLMQSVPAMIHGLS